MEGFTWWGGAGLVSDVDRVERFRLTFDFSIPTSNFLMTRRNFQFVLSVLF